MKELDQEQALTALYLFMNEWIRFGSITVDHRIDDEATKLAWDYQLRGYDAIHLASAITLQNQFIQDIRIATYDKALWKAASLAGLRAWPENFVEIENIHP